MEKNYDYYMVPKKIVRDLVHEYIDLTMFELELIDNASFQRLKDVRQLTCHHVYPEARHTRFEHSLGVLELTRKAINHLNRNGLILCQNSPKKCIPDKLIFNTCVAALLHDVGHCPFSHMGEGEFDKNSVRKSMKKALEEYYNETKTIGLTIPGTIKELIEQFGKEEMKDKLGSVHEQLSAIVILKNFKHLLLSVNPSDADGEKRINSDLEFIIRCIIGVEYNVNEKKSFEKHKEQNAMIRLINSSIFDMDKLDYIMRDSYFTGIGTPKIDTKRLFRNMYFDDKYSILFTSKAVPSLQNMIDARDGLYMYVYNHHAVVFSDFLNSYIVRRISHCTESLEKIQSKDKKSPLYNITDRVIKTVDFIPKNHLFSIDSVLKYYRSDGDWLSTLNSIHTHYNEVSNDKLKEIFKKEKIFLNEYEQEFIDRISNTISIVHQLRTRQFLKPWWKTVFEFNNYMLTNFPDDRIRKQIGKYICNGGDLKPDKLEASEFRSQIAKHVVFISKKVKTIKNSPLVAELTEGEFFIVQRSTRFFMRDTIEKISVCIKASEIIGAPKDADYKIDNYYVKSLTSIIPQKDYTSLYAKEGFYVYTAPIENYKAYDKEDAVLEDSRIEHNKCIEQIFVFVAFCLARDGEQNFVETFQKGSSEDIKQNEQKSMETMANAFINSRFPKEKKENEENMGDN